ncbi:hypothetical protein [Kitasatospora cheerisanensis]|uniref:Uncharacterized protein n=1 Tax=Kitasatospora cheerisanensis KCTC 2395 TaxID=1348663 RepID=A0A066YYX8_9ACTN|nr:hypothetical protein [Kitasatospora cheerisanensis]KDN86728.1 hypothetical protein KCH_15160 [Kitasatospora cheerisanensis KCTC 2395]
MTAPEQADLRQRLLDALDADAMRPRAERRGLVNAMLDVVSDDLTARDVDTARLREAHATMALQAGHYERRWESTVVEAQRQARRADELEQRAVDSAWNTMRLGEEITRLRKKLAAAETENTRLHALLAEGLPIAEAAQEASTVLGTVLALHRPVQRGAMTICDACSPRRGDGPSRYVLVGWPCPTADAINAATLPTT